jgi:hypothetical protein
VRSRLDLVRLLHLGQRRIVLPQFFLPFVVGLVLPALHANKTINVHVGANIRFTAVPNGDCCSFDKICNAATRAMEGMKANMA